jgi:hypothetical protein
MSSVHTQTPENIMNKSLALIVTVAAASLSIGCAADPAGSEGSEATGTDDVVQFTADSTYTAVWDEKSCKVEVEDPEGDSVSNAACKSSSPELTLGLWSGDLRERATLTGRGGELAITDALAEHVPESAAWNTIGPKAEWRTPRGDAAHPYALILRHTYETNPDGESVKQHYLAVVKISGGDFCLAGIVEASINAKNANADARVIADAARLGSCPDKIELKTKERGE